MRTCRDQVRFKTEINLVQLLVKFSLLLCLAVYGTTISQYQKNNMCTTCEEKNRKQRSGVD